ncbi:MAG: response regulator [Candidatus Omnitrophota bacterium]|jgi:YesN/AraC family two-component response regulator
MAGEKILIVDDSRNIRDIFSTAFDEYVILTASNAKEALDILKRPNDIELVVLDVMMPDMNGLELLNEVRKANAHCRIAVMTAYSSKDIAIEALRLHADEYIEKPFDIEDVRDIFRRLTRSSGRPEAQGVSETEKKIRLARRLIKRNYNKTLSLDSLSKELSLSYKYLSRVFKEKSGRSFNKYKLGLRISSAKQLLKKNSYPVSKIAYKLGYHNPNSFMKMFKKVTGFTPSEYRDTVTVKGRNK